MKELIAGVEIIVGDNVLHINDAFEPEIREVWEQLPARYGGFEVFLCYHNSVAPGEFLNEIGATLIDDCFEFRLEHEGLIPTEPNWEITPLTYFDFSQFAAMHDEVNPDMYWTSSRIRDDLDKWRIFIMARDGQVVGYVITAMWQPKQAEIFGLVAPTESDHRSLIASAARDVFASGKSQVLMMVDTDSNTEQAAASALGFRNSGFYQGFEAKV
jgi:hypothetical protein